MPKRVTPPPFVIDGPETRLLVPKGKGGVVETLIDTDDLHRVVTSELSWRVIRGTRKGGLPYVRGFSRRQGKDFSVGLSRWLLDAPAGVQVDHVNRDTLDNRRANLRLATRSQNGANCGFNPRNTSGFRGVSFHKELRKWQAQISGKSTAVPSTYLGVFDTAEEAAAAYDAAALALYGEFAQTNGRMP